MIQKYIIIIININIIIISSSSCSIYIIIIIMSYVISLYQANTIKAEIKIIMLNGTWHVELNFIQFQTTTPLSMNPLENAGNLDFFGQRPWRQGFQGLFSFNCDAVKFYSLSFLQLIIQTRFVSSNKHWNIHVDVLAGFYPWFNTFKLIFIHYKCTK